MPVQRVTGTVIIDGEEYGFENLDHVNDAYNTAGKVTSQLFTRTDVTDVADVEDISFDLMGQRVFTGYVDTIKSTGPAGIEVTTYDAVKRLKNTPMDKSFEDATVSHVVSEICEEAGVPYNIDIPERDRDEAKIDPIEDDSASVGPSIGSPGAGYDEDTGGEPTEQSTAVREDDGSVTVEFTKLDGASALDNMAEQANAVWYVSVYNIVTFTTSPDSVIHDLGNSETDPRGVVDASAGKTEPPYQSVYVIGDSAVNNDYFSRAHTHIIASNRVAASAGNGTPVYTVFTNNVYTEEEAQKVADSIYEQLQMQQKGGWVATIGAPEITLYDVIQMPEHLGGEQYMVAGVEHMIDEQNGYETTIQCGGLI